MSLSMIADGNDHEDGSTLSHIEMDQAVRFPGGPGIGMMFHVSNDSPRAGGPSLFKEDRLMYYLFQDHDLKPVVFVSKRHEAIDHDAATGDVTTIYEARIDYEKDAEGNITRVISKYSIRQSGKLVGEGTLKYQWNAEKAEFVEVR